MNSPAAFRPWTPWKSGRACPDWCPPSASPKAPSCSKGDLLFQIDPRPFQAEVDRLQAELDSRARHGAARDSELERAERLRSENAISNEEHDRRAAFAQESAAQVAAVEAALRAAELNLEFTRVTSPINGRVGRAIVTEGNLVSSGPGEATLLTTVVSLDPVYAYFDADEQIYPRVHGRRRAKRADAHRSPADPDGARQRRRLSARRAARLPRQPAR